MRARALSIGVAVLVVGCGSRVVLPPSPSPTISAAAVSPSASATPARSATPTASAALARTLGGATLGMSEAEVLAALGQPAERTLFVHLPQWRYASGLYVNFDGQEPDRVYEVGVQAPFAGRTAEGFALGGTPDDFRKAYAGYAVADENTTPPDFQHIMRARDAATTVMAQFSRDERAFLIAIGVR